MSETIDQISGLTAEERQVIDYTVKAWQALRELEGIGGTDDMRDASQAIRTIQRIVAGRVMKRLYPEFWR